METVSYLVGAFVLVPPAAAETCFGAKADASEMDCLLDLGFRTRLALLMNFFKPLGSSFLSPGAPWPEEDIMLDACYLKFAACRDAINGRRRERRRRVGVV